MKVINYTTDESQAGIVYRMPTHPTDLCKTPSFAQFLCQAQILILKILNVFLWLIPIYRDAFLELERN